ncbi:hypothetical protein IHE61_09950 [Streptomyces sp. GKU 257-1]|nr:hypothetical protein [Streptomyces sp. GKU 257-1]
METAAWGKPFRLTLTEPTFVCWFLVALFVWRLTVPLWRVIPRPLPVAVLVSLARGRHLPPPSGTTWRCPGC